jgi:uncharacterized protein (DUF2235 family)
MSQAKDQAAVACEGSVQNPSEPKSIILFSDGTGNSSAKLFKTNVWRMYEAVDLGPAAPGKRKQIAYYDNGVGSGGLRPLAALAGIFGFGLKRNVLQLYRYACRNYAPAQAEVPNRDAPMGGDAIYAFGFSRGAFTIRLLAALIADQGLVVASSERELLRKSADAYRAFRACFLPRRLQWPTKAWRAGRAVLSAGWRKLWKVEPYDPTNNYRPSIRFVGVWDTVAAYGGPIGEITRGIDNWIYALSMSNYRLSPRVERARHALAIDDERDAFHPLLWDEVHEDALVERGVVERDRLQQVWFTGMHADVGGGYPDESLSYVSFLWMLNEAREAGLRPLSVVTDRFRALANSAGPLHDSRSGPGAYYRYQPRNIGAWLHPPDGESIVHDPQLVDDDGQRQGLLTRVQVHESVIARIANGTDGYAPFTLPNKLLVVPPHVGGETALQKDHVTPVVPPAEEQTPVPLLAPELRARAEDPKVGAARCDALASVWDLVWWRRILYFGTLFLTLALVLMPLWIHRASDPLFLADGRTWIGGVIRMLSMATPEFLDPLIETMANNSFYFIVLVVLIAAMMFASTRVERALRDRTRRIWRESLRIGGRLPEAAPPSFLQEIRTSKLYRRPFRMLKWTLLPAASALLILLLLAWLLFGFYTQVRLPGLERGSALCPPFAGLQPLESVSFDFSPSAACVPVGAGVVEGQRYVVDIQVTDTWYDGELETTPEGVTAWGHGLSGYLGVPFRRVITASYLQPVLEIRGPAGDLRGERIHIDRIDLQPQGDSAKLWRGTFEAARSGDLFLFANEAVLPFRSFRTYDVRYFYEDGRYGNTGAAWVTIRRADIEPDPARSGCAAAAQGSGAEAAE